jgi:hypothetical protein
MNPDPLLFAPHDAARQMPLIGFDHQREAFGNADGRDHLERGAGLRKIANRAIEGGAAAKRNLARLQQPPPWCHSMFVHHLDLHLSTGVFGLLSYYPVTGD